MLRPKKRLVDVDTERTEETSTLDGLVNEVVDESEGSDVEENLASLEIEEMIQDDTVSERKFPSKVTVNGKEVHKASVIRILLNEDEEQSSNDRLRGVRGYTKHPGKVGEVQDDVDLDDCIMIGDMLAGKVQLNETAKLLASLCILRIRSIKEKSSKKYETIINSIDIGNKSFTGLIMEGKVIDENLLVDIPKNINKEININGSMVVYVKIRQSKLPDAKRVFVILPIKLSHCSSSLLPYHLQLSETQCIEALSM